MAKKQYIRHLYEEEGMSIREIARTAKCNFRTARKYAVKSTNKKSSPLREKFRKDLRVDWIEKWA